MAFQFSTTVRNARLAAIESTIGTSPILRIYTGAAPANCAAAATGTLLAALNLPSDWEAAPSGGGSAINGGPWVGTASAAGTAGHFRLYDSTGATCHMQGSVGQGSGDMTFDNTNIAVGQTLNITAFAITEGGA